MEQIEFKSPIESYSDKNRLKNKGLWNRVPFYWKNATYIQRLYVGENLDLSLFFVVASVICAAVGSVLFLVQGHLLYGLTLIPLILWGLPFSLLSWRISKHRPLENEEFYQMRAHAYTNLDPESKKKLKKMAKAVRKTPDHPRIKDFGAIVEEYSQHYRPVVKVPKALQSKFDEEVAKIKARQFAAREAEAQSLILKSINDKTEPPSFDEEWNIIS